MDHLQGLHTQGAMVALSPVTQGPLSCFATVSLRMYFWNWSVKLLKDCRLDELRDLKQQNPWVLV